MNVPIGGDTPTSDDVGDVVAGWRRAEERLYPIVMVDPDRYRRLLSVIRATADRLATHASTPDLVAARAQGGEVVAEVAESVGVPATELGDVELTADAAFSLRHREIIGEDNRRAVRERIAAARARGDAWAVIREYGRQDQPGVQPYERIEMRMADARGLRAAADVDADSYRPLYTLDELILDPTTGQVLDAATSIPTRTFTDRGEWEAAGAEWRAASGSIDGGA